MKYLTPEQIKTLESVIAENAFMGFLTFDAQSRTMVHINRLGRELFEVMEQSESRVPVELDQIFAQSARGDFRAFNDDLLTHEGFYQDVIVRKLSGQTFVANIGVKRLELVGDPLVLLMVQDITLQKKLQRELVAKQLEIKSAFEELLRQNKQLKELDLAKNRFIALTTHELRTPLAAMVASAEVLHLGLYDSEEQMKEFIGMIYEQGQHLHDLVNDILDFAKIQAGRMDFYIEERDPTPLVQVILEGFSSMAEASSISLELKPLEPPIPCFFDSLRLKQVISNILNNAIKYNRPGGKAIVTFEANDEFVKILISDTGKGIPEEQIEKVFNEFETLGQVATHHKGTGLGMPISRRLMEGMGGKLLVKSEVGVGSTFWVEIPRHKILADEVYRARPDISDNLAA